MGGHLLRMLFIGANMVSRMFPVLFVMIKYRFKTNDTFKSQIGRSPLEKEAHN